MVLLLCFPVFGSTPGHVCCVPTHIFLQVLSIILILLLLPILIINTFDSGEINLGFVAMNLFILGTLLFIVFGILGLRRFSEGFIITSLTIWIVTYAGFLIFAVYSVWSSQTIERSSINGRCAMNLWLFDWCCKTRTIQCNTTGKLTGSDNGIGLSILQGLHVSNYLWHSIESVNDNLLEKYELSDKSNTEKINGNLTNLTESFVTSTSTFTVTASTKSANYFNHSRINQQNLYKDDRLMFRSGSKDAQENQNEYKRDKRDVEGRHEHQKSATAMIGTICIMTFVIGLYTLYAVTLNDVLTVLRYPFPLIFVTRMENDTQEEGASTTQQRSPSVVLK